MSLAIRKVPYSAPYANRPFGRAAWDRQLAFLKEMCSHISMERYKRNQVAEAISSLLAPKARKPPTEVTTRLKRLLDTDRSFGRAVRSSDPRKAHYAFFSADAPGTGVEVWFTPYEAFALLQGLLLMHHGWTQGFAVSVMRDVRPKLEAQYARILTLEPDKIFDPDAIHARARQGDMAFNTTQPLLLVIVPQPGLSAGTQAAPVACGIFESVEQASEFAQKQSGGRGGWTLFELVKTAHTFASRLEQTEPRRRGRGA
jgi:hypothetical protein